VTTPPELTALVDRLGVEPGQTILICGLDYWPDVTGIAPYTTALAEHLAATGHEVHVIAGMPYYPAWKIAPGYRRTLRRTESRHGVTIHRYRQLVSARQTALTRAAYEASLLANALASRRHLRPNLVIGVVPALSDGLLAAWLARRHGVPLSLWIQDLLGQAATQSGVEGGRAVARLTAALEGWIARQADAVAIIADGFRAPLEAQGVDPAKIHRVHNWTHIAAPTRSAAETRTLLNLPQDRTVCLHAGNMGLKQGLEVVVEAARLAETAAPHLQFVLLGNGNQRAHLERLGAGLPNLSFRDPVDDDLFPDALACADVLLLTQRASVTDMSLPSKLTSYQAVGRPILAAVHPGSETAAAVTTLPQGSVVAADDPAALLDGIAAARITDVPAFTSPAATDACLATQSVLLGPIAGLSPA